MSAALESFVTTGKKILGAGENHYALLKLRGKTKPNVPLIFMKPTTAYVEEGNQIIIPKDFKVNQGIELGVIIGQKGKLIPEEEAMDYVGGYCAALDMTATSVLGPAKKSGHPWVIGKGFDTACPVSKFIPKDEIKDLKNVELWCKLNGKLIQKAKSSDMVFSIPYLISYISRFITLEPNDLILTGSPPGMSPVNSCDIIEGGIEGVVSFNFGVVAE